MIENNDTAIVALSCHDSVYLIDFAVKKIPLEGGMPLDHDVIAESIIKDVQKYEQENFYKFIGAGMPTTLEELSPSLCSRLWLELDIVPIVMQPDGELRGSKFDIKSVDEQADSMARKCIMYSSSILAEAYSAQHTDSSIGTLALDVCRCSRSASEVAWRQTRLSERT